MASERSRRSTATTAGVEEAAASVVIKDVLQNDTTVKVTFPLLKPATVETIIAYLIYKHRYEGYVLSKRPPFDIPVASALEIMKMAAVLEC